MSHSATSNANQYAPYRTQRRILARLPGPTNRLRHSPLDDHGAASENPAVYTISVEGGFRATHHVRLLGGATESPHPHDWKVRVFLSRGELDQIGMVADFETVQRALIEAILPFQHADLNALPSLARLNPTAEVLARAIFDRLAASGLGDLRRVEVTEAPGCVASYEID